MKVEWVNRLKWKGGGRSMKVGLGKEKERKFWIRTGYQESKHHSEL